MVAHGKPVVYTISFSDNDGRKVEDDHALDMARILGESLPYLEARFGLTVEEGDDAYQLSERIREKHDDDGIAYGPHGGEFCSIADYFHMVNIKGTVHKS